jgi:hypothetical protein
VVIRALLVVLALAPLAHADNLLGTRIGYGSIPVEDEPMTTMSLAVTLDHPLAGRWRIAAEYEYLWIGERDLDAHMESGVASLSDSGHRAHVGLRRRLLDKQYAEGMVELFLDGEFGGGAMLVDREAGALALPHVFAGIRAGLALEADTRWEYELFVRGLGVEHGPGVLFGIGLVWGD